MVSKTASAKHDPDADTFSINELAKLYPYELKWRERQPALLEKGYQLRPRFRPGWKPSWKKWDWLPRWIKYGLMNPYGREDSLPLMWGELIMDAIRVSDDAPVVMKIIDKHAHPEELNIARSFTPLRDDRNHCVPVWDFFDAPDDSARTIIVMPLLRKFDDPPFETVGEVVECVRQLLEGLQFMHEHNVAHRDCFTPNIMMDASPLYIRPFHPSNPAKRRDWKGPVKAISRTEYYNRTRKHVKYYFIDFGISKRYPAGSTASRELPIIPADKSVPEHQGALYHTPSNPFATDVYLLGNAIRERFMKRPGFEKLRFMEALVLQMTAENPLARPKIGEAVARFATLDPGNLDLSLSTASRGTGAQSASSRIASQPAAFLSPRQPETLQVAGQQSLVTSAVASTSQHPAQTLKPGKDVQKNKKDKGAKGKGMG
ncbi:unnamed protein product [Peniophora sp. CBMAI 1063]|nr:unnamed protein product [Peniophora sp. CBMAI 1063]